MALSFPSVLLTSYVQNSPPAIKAFDLNGLQVEALHARRLLQGIDFRVSDDFSGTTLDTNKWVDIGANSTVTVDVVNGASGVVQPTNNLAIMQLETQPTYPGANDFWMFKRSRVVDWNINSLATFGFPGAAPVGSQAYFFADFNLFANWQAVVGAGTNDTGIPVASIGYHDYEIIRRGNVIYFLIDGVIVYSQAYSFTITAVNFTWQTIAGANPTSIWVDSLALTFERRPVQSATGAAQIGSHVEAETVNFTLLDINKVMTFSTPFLTAPTFVLNGPNQVAPGGALPEFTVQTTINDMTITPAVPFAGDVTFYVWGD